LLNNQIIDLIEVLILYRHLSAFNTKLIDNCQLTIHNWQLLFLNKINMTPNWSILCY